MSTTVDRRPAQKPQQQKPSASDGTLVAQSEIDEIAKLDDFCKSSALAIQHAHDSGSDMQKALILARATVGIRNRLTPAIMADVMQLQGSPLGFKTDKDRNGGYPVDEVKTVLTQALIQRLRVTGNEWNIIAGNLYPTVQGLKRLVSEFPGLTDLDIQVGVPVKASDETSLVPCTAKWKYEGTPYSIECIKTESMDGRIPVKYDKWTSIDAIIGKAKSKLYRRIYERMTGSILTVYDEDEGTNGTGTEPLTAATNAEIETAEFEVRVAPEQLPFEFEAELKTAVSQCTTSEHFANAKLFWLEKASNRGFTDGQKLTVESMFEGK